MCAIASIGEKIRALRNERKLTQAALAKEINVKPVTVSKWELDVSKPKGASLILLAEFFSVLPETFISDMKKIIKMNDRLIPIPYYNDVSAAAGNGFFCGSQESDPLYVNARMIRDRENTVALNVRGDSMEPVFSDGTIVFINHRLTNVVDGKVYVFSHDELVRMKVLELIPKGYRLKSYNEKYRDEDVNLKDDNIHIIGEVVAQIQMYC